MATQRTWLVLLFVSVSAALPAQYRLREHMGANPVDRFGSSVAGIGDIDGDGFPDYAVGAVDTDYGGLTDSGSVYTYSGATGALIWRADGTAAGQKIGESVSGGKDFDFDGFPDVLVTSLVSNGGVGGYGIYSGFNGASLLQRAGIPGFGFFGYFGITVDDLNVDLVPDVVIGRYTGGQIDAFSGLTGTLIYSASTPGAGRFVAQIGDLDGDGVGDLAAAGSSATVVSGRTGTILATGFGDRLSAAAFPDRDGDGKPEMFLAGALVAGAGTPVGRMIGSASGLPIWTAPTLPLRYSAFIDMGLSCCIMGDVDGDAVNEIAVGSPYSISAPGTPGPRGAVIVLSGATGQIVQIVRGESGGGYLGTRLAAIGDVDGDGWGDVATSAFGAYGDRGRCLIFTTSPGSSASEIILDGASCASANDFLTLNGTGLLTLGSTGSAAVIGPTGPNRPGLLAFEVGLAVRQPILGCTLYLNIANLPQWTQVPFTTNASGTWSLPYSVPNDPNFVGMPLVVQAAVDGGSGVTLLNGLQLLIGN